MTTKPEVSDHFRHAFIQSIDVPFLFDTCLELLMFDLTQQF